MAKRARGSTTRPGQRAPLQRAPGSRPAGAPAARPTGQIAPASPTLPAARPATLTEEEAARAAELEAKILADERAAEESARRGRATTRRGSTDPVARPGALGVRAAEEYGYVVRDVRRIAVIGGALIAVLLAIWAFVQATGTGAL
ncbi:MAG: hypothetical protein WEG56_06660 [Chloroflexota bacterium]